MHIDYTVVYLPNNNMKNIHSDLLKVSRFAELERVKRDTIYKRIKAGELPIVKIGEVIFIEAEYLSKS